MTLRRRSTIKPFLTVSAFMLLLGLFLPGGAAAVKAGGGVLEGEMTLDDPGLAPLGWTWTCPTFTFSASAEFFVLDAFVNDNTATERYAGPVRLSGSGAMLCGTFSANSGDLTATLEGENVITGSKIRCEQMHGGFVRTLTRMGGIVGGVPCVVNGVSTTKMLFEMNTAFIPEGPGAGITESIKRATLVIPMKPTLG